MISYAQNREDVLLARFFAGDGPQFYVDVGAAHPTVNSVTRHFYEQGWRGLNIEPRAQHLDLFIRQRPRDTNLQLAISSTSGSLHFFNVKAPCDEKYDNGELSTLDAELAEHYRENGFEVCEFTIIARRLDELLEEHCIQEIGFLKIDVEGAELQVVQSLDWQRWRPRIVVMESTIPRSPKRTDGKAERWVESHGYRLATFDGLNSYYVRVEDSQRIDRLAVPISVFDSYQTYEQHQLNQQLIESQVHLKSVKEMNADLRAESDRVLAELTGLLAERAGLLTEKTGLLAEYATLLAERTDLLAENAGLVAEMTGLLVKNGRLTEDTDRLRRELEATLAALRSELATPLWKKAERAIRTRRRAAAQTLVRHFSRICGQ